MEELREYLKRELGVSDAEYERMKEDAKKRSITKSDLQNLAMVEVNQMQMVDSLGKTVSMLMGKVAELEVKLNG